MWTDPQIWLGLATLTLLEVVLGVDNVVFISILSGKLPESQRAKAWNMGLLMALVTRLILLGAISLVTKLEGEIVRLGNTGYSGKDLILLLGGLFLIYKSVKEIHGKLEGEEDVHVKSKSQDFVGIAAQMFVLNLIFSLDSVMTAIGMSGVMAVMVAAIVISTALMLWFAKPVGAFVERHPTIKMLGLAFLVLIGTNLIAEGLHAHIEKGYTYFAMAFAVIVEMLNLRLRSKAKPVSLHEPKMDKGT